MHPTRSFLFSCLALVAIAAFSGQAFAGSTAVGLCSAPGTHYTTIQAAVTAVEALTPPNTVRVCPGKYEEQVVIDAPLTLEGIQSTAPPPTQDAAIISAAGGVAANTSDVCPSQFSGFCTNGNPIAAQLLVENTSGVMISNLTVDGAGNGLPVCSGTDLMGILFQNASGTVNRVAVRNQVTGDTVNGCQAGKGIYVESGTGSSSVLVENSSVHNYSKNGITGRYPGTTLTATGNYVQGSGVQSGGDAQNGIEIAFGANGSIKTNTVIDNVYEDPSSIGNAATDVLLYDAEEDASIAVNSNVLGNSQIAISLQTDNPGTYGDGVYVESNRIFGTGAWDGIDLCTSGSIVKGNTIANSAESGIHLDHSCGLGNSNQVTGNTILESACAGILADSGTSGNTTTPDTYFTVPFPVASSTSGCTIPEFGGAVRTRAQRKLTPVP